MITGWWQTDSRLLTKIQEFGCAILDCCYLSPIDFEPSDVNEMYKALLQVGFIDEDCTILDWASVLNSVWANLHFKTKTIESYVCTVDEREIIKWWLSNMKEDHFTIGNGASKTAWDSMDRPDIMAKYATFLEKVVIKIS